MLQAFCLQICCTETLWRRHAARGRPQILAWRRPIGCRPNDPTPAYPKARTSSGEAGQLQNRPFVHRTGWGVHGACWASIGRVVRPWDGLGRPRGALFVHQTFGAAVWHRIFLATSCPPLFWRSRFGDAALLECCFISPFAAMAEAVPAL